MNSLAKRTSSSTLRSMILNREKSEPNPAKPDRFESTVCACNFLRLQIAITYHHLLLLEGSDKSSSHGPDCLLLKIAGVVIATPRLPFAAPPPLIKLHFHCTDLRLGPIRSSYSNVFALPISSFLNSSGLPLQKLCISSVVAFS